MERNENQTANGIPRWACPWAAGWSGMQAQSPSLPLNSRRRIKRIGIAASGVAAAVWLVAVVWMWQIVA